MEGVWNDTVPSKCPTITKPFIYLFILTWVALWNWIGCRGLVFIEPATLYLTLYPRIKFWTLIYPIEKKFQREITFTQDILVILGHDSWQMLYSSWQQENKVQTIHGQNKILKLSELNHGKKHIPGSSWLYYGTFEIYTPFFHSCNRDKHFPTEINFYSSS